MRALTRGLAGVMVVALPLLAPASLRAQQVGPSLNQAEPLPNAIVAVIDYQKILRESAAARSIRDQIEGRRSSYQDEISTSEQKLQAQDRELAKQRSLLSADAFATKRKAFEEEVASVQKLVQERRRLLDDSTGRAINEVRQSLIEIVTGFAQTRGFNVVLPNSEVLFFSRQIDLTDEVMAELDRKLPSVQVNFAANQ
ncbi:OmpH family outer membrane protein [Marinivivus vitaminiproducens]|uniref:OmpH family outer membrane protein n=1 Tax=Marinivivus vitaminiproducens TaxID=3035935 RepID=UPI0027A422A2|nr:OmpH family outer membrane protein [Geminicoccaceae bacterium SCSIO 64248]